MGACGSFLCSARSHSQDPDFTALWWTLVDDGRASVNDADLDEPTSGSKALSPAALPAIVSTDRIARLLAESNSSCWIGTGHVPEHVSIQVQWARLQGS